MMDKIFDMIDVETIEKLAEIVSKNELSEISLSEGNQSITVKGRKVTNEYITTGAVQAAAPAPYTAPVGIEAAKTETASAAPEFDGNVVKCPIVGTYYAAPSPEKPPFVKVGDQVKKGDVIMIIESMKLMNEIQSDYEGTVTDILVDNGQAVEYDQPLMIIK